MVEKFLGELKAKGLRQVDIAEKIGITQAQVSRLSRGATPSLDDVIRLADAYGVTTDHVLGRTART